MRQSRCAWEASVGIKLVSLRTTAGYLQASPIRFADGLTCIIGARGTCKSTIIETIRFAFDCDPDRVRELTADSSDESDGLPSTHGLVKATLAGGTARCEALDRRADGSVSWVIEREVGGQPRLFRDGVVELTTPGLLSQIEIYSQGDLQRIAQHGRLRLDLIDRPNRERTDALLAARASAGARLRELGTTIRQLRSAIESRRVEIKPLEGLRAELAAAQGARPALSAELDRERAGFEARRVALEGLEAALARRAEMLTALRLLPGQWEAHQGLAEVAGCLPAPAPLVLERLERFGTALRAAVAAIDASGAEDVSSQMADLRAASEAQNEAYYKIRREQQEINDALRKEDHLRQQIKHLEGAERELAAHSQALEQALAERAAKRRAIEEASEALYQLRLAQVEEINETCRSVVTLTLQWGTQSERYEEAIKALLQGSRLHRREDLAAQIAAKVRPADLVDIVEAGDAVRLASLLDRDKAQMARVVTAMLDQPTLYDIEGIVFEDWLEITMFVEKVPKPINQLSKGQMATALLPLILRPADYPLVFDQPEDDLDNRFVYETLVTRIHDLKHRRQLVLVTHNANIPVLGEAEKVVVMGMATPQKAGPALEGDVEAMRQPILGLLEGGAEAFRRRQDRYGELLKD